MLKNQPAKEEILESIQEGVKEAFLEMMDSKNTYRNEEVMEAIKNGVQISFPYIDSDRLYDIIYDATNRAMIDRN